MSKPRFLLSIGIFVFILSCSNQKTSSDSKVMKGEKILSSEKLSLSQMQDVNGEAISKLESKLEGQILTKSFKELYEESDTSLSSKIGWEDIKLYFQLMESYYGELLSVNESGTINDS